MPQALSPVASKLSARDRSHLIHPWVEFDAFPSEPLLPIVRAEGAYLYDVDGRRYLDAVGGMWCNNIGAGRAEMADAIAAQVRTLSFSNIFVDMTHPAAIELAEKVTSLAPTGLDHVFFSTCGSTAVDTAFRLIQFYQNCRGRTEKKHIIARRESYHGSTYAAQSIAGKSADRIPEFDFIPDLVHHVSAPYDYRRPAGMEGLSEQGFVDALVREFEQAIEAAGGPGRVAAFFAEPIMGAGGVIVPPRDYLRRMFEVCRANDILFVADEVVTGFGRVGHWFASEDLYGVQPDLLTTAKGITSGYVPLGATLVSDRVYETISEPGHGRILTTGFTYSAHPVAAAAALENIAILARERLLENAREVGTYFERQLATLLDLPIVGNVRGCRMMQCVEFVRDRETRELFPEEVRIGKVVSDQADARGLIVRPIAHQNVMSPALVIDRAGIDFIVSTLRESIVAATRQLEREGVL
jgi:adenosylmethionine-8-amino-7-oxononanoate aminotransferase